jgi:hypothetical protein
MPKLKNMSRGGYIVVGIVAALILVPTGIAVAAVAYTGVEGTNGTTSTVNHAEVTSAGQLTVTETAPKNYKSYLAEVESAGTECVPVSPVLPTGFALDLKDLSVAFLGADAQTTSGSTNEVGGNIRFYVAIPSESPCVVSKSHPGFIGDAIAPGGNTGNVDLPESPGFVVPKGYQVYAEGLGATAWVTANGYLIPSSDAPSAPG